MEPGAVQTAKENELSHSRNMASNLVRKWATVRTYAFTGSGKILPISANGVTTVLTNGMATALAIGPMTEIRPKKSIVRGTRPMVTAHCVAAAVDRECLNRFRREGFSSIFPVLPLVAYRIMPTAPNDSQKPGCRSAHGSKRQIIPQQQARYVKTVSAVLSIGRWPR